LERLIAILNKKQFTVISNCLFTQCWRNRNCE